MNAVFDIYFVVQSLHDTVAQFTSMDYAAKDLSGSEDGTHIFEVIVKMVFSKSFLFVS